MKWVKQTFNFLHGVKVEGRKVHWSTKQELLQSTGIVLLFVLIAGTVIFFYDQIFSTLIRMFLS